MTVLDFGLSLDIHSGIARVIVSSLLVHKEAGWSTGGLCRSPTLNDRVLRVEKNFASVPDLLAI